MLGATQILPLYWPNAGLWIRVLVVVAIVVIDDNDNDDNHCIDTLAFQMSNPSPTPIGLWCPNAASHKGLQLFAILGII